MAIYREKDIFERRNAANDAKKALLERFKARPADDDPAVLARKAERQAIIEAREKRAIEKEKQRQEKLAREAAERAAREAAEEAARLAAEEAAQAEAKADGEPYLVPEGVRDRAEGHLGARRGTLSALVAEVA